MRRTGRRAQSPSNGSLLGALFIADGVGGASDAIAAIETAEDSPEVRTVAEIMGSRRRR